MPSLSSLIVQRQVASIAEVEQAIARQVIHGGDLVTNLLEVSPHCEHSLTRVLAESLGIPSVPPGRLPAPEDDVLDIVPVETALRYGVFPLRLSSKTLVISTSERLKPTVVHDLAYTLGLDISQVAAPLIRIREGIAAHYGVPLEPRQLRLVQKLDASVDGAGLSPTRPQAQAQLPVSPSILPSNLSSGVSSHPSALDTHLPATRRKGSTLEMEEVRDHARDLAEAWVVRDTPVEPAPEGALHEERTSEEPAPLLEGAEHESPPAEEAVAFEEAPPETMSEEGLAFVSAPPPPVTDPEPPTVGPRELVERAERAAPSDASEKPFPPNDSPRPPGMVDRRAVANLLKREIGARRKSAAKSARKKGPFSRHEAERELETARTPEDVCDTFFAFGSQFFEYSALFVVHGEIVEGRDAWGPGADHLRVLGLGVPLDLPSSLAIVRKEGHVLLSRFDELDLDRELLRDLERSRARVPVAALVPLTMRGRAVAVLYGDDGATDVTLASLGDLLGFSALASARLERIVLAKKRQSGPFSGLVAPRVQPSSVEALARAFSLPLPPSAAPSFPGATSPGEEPRASEPNVSPGATTVHPPKMVTASWEDEEELTIPRRQVPKPAPVSAPVPEASSGIPYAPTEIAATAIGRISTLSPSSEMLSEVQASPSASSTDFRFEQPSPQPSLAAKLEVSPLTSSIEQLSAPGTSSPSFADVSEDRAREGLDEHAEQNGVTPQPPLDEAHNSSRPFVPPIPRVDDDDASLLIATNVEEGQEPSHPLRHEAEPASQDGRIGSYQLVPRPADARLRHDSSDLALLLDRATAGGLEGEEALSELLRRAEAEFPRFVERFPGPLLVDRLRARADLPPASECGPLLKVIVMMRRVALPFMTVRSTSADTEHRFWATHVLGELLLPEASNAILPRLFDDDVTIRRVARRAAQALATAGAPGEPLKHSLAHTMKSADEPMQRRLLAIEALSDIRVPSVVPILITGLYEESEAVIEAARTALMIVTRQDLGRNPQVWTAWWELHQSEHRVEWLIQSLTHDTPSIRRAAGDELKHLTREYFGYYDDLPLRERERAQSRYAQWWQDDGQYRFR